MIKNIKRVGIIFLAVAIVCLMMIGCLVVTKVSDNIENVSVLNKDFQSSQNILTDYSNTIPTTDKTFICYDERSLIQAVYSSNRVIKIVLSASILVPQEIEVENILVIDFAGYGLEYESGDKFNIAEGASLYLTSSKPGGYINDLYPAGDRFNSSGCGSIYLYDNVKIFNLPKAIKCQFFNMYGGEISNNRLEYSGSENFIGLIECETASLYGGKIVNNILKTNDDIGYDSTYRNMGAIKGNINLQGDIITLNNFMETFDELRQDFSLNYFNQPITLTGVFTGCVNINYGIGSIAIKDYGKYSNNEEIYSIDSCFKSIRPSVLLEYDGNNLKTKLWNLSDISIDGLNGVQNVGESSFSKEYSSKNMTFSATIYDGYIDEPLRIKLSTATTYSSSATLTGVGKYVFNVEGCSRTFTIEVTPKKLNTNAINWGNTNFTYNGASQKPTATLSSSAGLVSGDTASVIVSGEQIDCGTHTAVVTGISNKNYELQSTYSTSYKINSTNLVVNVTTNNVQASFTGSNVIPNNWYTLSTNGLLGRDSGKSLSSLFTINDNAFIPQFNGKDGAVDLGEYTISTKPINDINLAMYGNNNYNVTFNYINSGKLSIVKPSVVRTSVASKYNYLVYENNRRVTYAEKGWIHGVDDNARSANELVLGNIMPNTSVQSFLDNLVFNDMTALTLKNSKGEIIYTNGEIDSKYSALINNGMELAIGTGWTLEYERERITLSVLGDLTGDGKLNSTDVNVARQIVNNNSFESLDNYMKYSMLIINKGNIPNDTDTEILWNVVCGKMDIESFI